MLDEQRRIIRPVGSWRPATGRWRWRTGLTCWTGSYGRTQPAGVDKPDEMFDRWRYALSLPGIYGLVTGRNLLYPPDDDVAGAVDTAVDLL